MRFFCTIERKKSPSITTLPAKRGQSPHYVGVYYGALRHPAASLIVSRCGIKRGQSPHYVGVYYGALRHPAASLIVSRYGIKRVKRGQSRKIFRHKRKNSNIKGSQTILRTSCDPTALQ